MAEEGGELAAGVGEGLEEGLEEGMGELLREGLAVPSFSAWGSAARAEQTWDKA